MFFLEYYTILESALISDGWVYLTPDLDIFLHF